MRGLCRGGACSARRQHRQHVSAPYLYPRSFPRSRGLDVARRGGFMSPNPGQSRESKNSPECWPSLPLESWEPTRATLHMWTQIVGKVRLALTPMVNHWWNVPLYVSARGLTTSSMPYRDLVIEIEFDFIAHQLVLRKSDGNSASIALAPKSVADFYSEFFAMLRSQNIDTTIWKMPVEIADPIPFDQDKTLDS